MANGNIIRIRRALETTKLGKRQAQNKARPLFPLVCNS
jgi:hypothetical protein